MLNGSSLSDRTSVPHPTVMSYSARLLAAGLCVADVGPAGIQDGSLLRSGDDAPITVNAAPRAAALPVPALP